MNKSKQQLYLDQLKKDHNIIIFFRYFLFIQFLIVWELLSRFHYIDSFFYSSPSQIVILFIDMCKDFELFIHTGITVFETFISFIFVNIISLLMAIILISRKKLSLILEPYLVVLNSLPKSALAPLIIVWMGSGTDTIIVAGSSVALFGSIINLYTGFQSVDSEKIKLITTLGGKQFDRLTKVIIPSSLPIIISNMKVNIGLCLVGVIIGEFLAAKKGLGYLIIYSSQVFQLDLLILSIIILCFIAFFLYQSIDYLEKKF